MTQLLELKEESRSRRREGLIVAAVAVVVVIVGGLFAGATWLGSDEASDSVVPTSTEPRAVAEDFLDAYGANDADRAMTFLTDSAIEDAWSSADEMRDGMAWNRAIGRTQLIDNCHRTSGTAGAVTLLCEQAVHAIGSEELGLGPYGDGYWALTVEDGRITRAIEEFPFDTNGFSREVWAPFAVWVAVTFPEDAAIMYTDANRDSPNQTPESFRLWEQHIRDYVAAKTGQASQ